MKIRVVFTGRSYPMAEGLPEELTLGEDDRLAAALDQLAARLPQDQPLPASCLVSVSGRHVGTLGSHEDCALRDGDELVLIAPVAGG
jgi:molybdopterin converting factor small subunit